MERRGGQVAEGSQHPQPLLTIVQYQVSTYTCPSDFILQEGGEVDPSGLTFLVAEPFWSSWNPAAMGPIHTNDEHPLSVGFLMHVPGFWELLGIFLTL